MREIVFVFMLEFSLRWVLRWGISVVVIEEKLVWVIVSKVEGSV